LKGFQTFRSDCGQPFPYQKWCNFRIEVIGQKSLCASERKFMASGFGNADDRVLCQMAQHIITSIFVTSDSFPN
jgi:hypothetical protein